MNIRVIELDGHVYILIRESPKPRHVTTISLTPTEARKLLSDIDTVLFKISQDQEEGE